MKSDKPALKTGAVMRSSAGIHIALAPDEVGYYDHLHGYFTHLCLPARGLSVEREIAQLCMLFVTLSRLQNMRDPALRESVPLSPETEEFIQRKLQPMPGQILALVDSLMARQAAALQKEESRRQAIVDAFAKQSQFEHSDDAPYIN